MVTKISYEYFIIITIDTKDWKEKENRKLLSSDLW